MNEDRTREMLAELAAHVPPPSAEPGTVAMRARRRIARTAVSGLLAFALTAGGGFVLARSIEDREAAPVAPFGMKESSGLSEDGTLRCVARVPVPLQPGERTGMTIHVENVSGRPVEYAGADASIEVAGKPTPGAHQFSRPMPQRQTLAAGATLPIPFADPVVRWSGPLDLIARCMITNQSIAVPPIKADVIVPGPNPSRQDAIRRALAARPGLLERCMPKEDGGEATGELTAPDPALPPLTARCAAVVTEEEGFDVVDIQIVAPADAPPVEFPDDLNQIAFPGSGPPGDGTVAMLRWRIIVTADEVIDEGECCEAAERTLPAAEHRLAPFLTWREGRWRAEGASACGGMGNGFTWISVCSVNVTSSSTQKSG